MNKYIKELDKYLDENPPEFGCNQMVSVFGQLYCGYLHSERMDSQQVRKAFRKMGGLLSKLTLEENDAVINTVCDLCTIRHRESFEEGIRVGFHLYRELMGRGQP